MKKYHSIIGIGAILVRWVFNNRIVFVLSGVKPNNEYLKLILFHAHDETKFLCELKPSQSLPILSTDVEYSKKKFLSQKSGWFAIKFSTLYERKSSNYGVINTEHTVEGPSY